MICGVVLTVCRSRFGVVLPSKEGIHEAVGPMYAFDRALYERSDLQTAPPGLLLKFLCLMSNIVHYMYLSGAHSNFDLSAELAQMLHFPVSF